MPYITDERRNQLAEITDAICFELPSDVAPGDLNYLISMLAKRYVEIRGKRYQSINDVLGALNGASKEFYRRVAAPYEDEKIDENGDVY